MVENDEDQPADGHFQSTDQPLNSEYSQKASHCAAVVAPLIERNISKERLKNVRET